MKNKIKVNEIHDQIYGDGGLLDRVRAEIDRRGIPVVAKLTHKSRQTIHSGIMYSKLKSEIKLSTIIEFARWLNIE